MSIKIFLTTRDGATFALNYNHIKQIPLLDDISKNLIRQRDEAVKVHLDKITGEQFENLKQWLEQRKFSTERQALQLLVTANYLLMDDLLEEAATELAQSLSQRNSEQLMQLMIGGNKT